MKKLFFAFLLTCLTAPSFAQFSIGLSGGANLSFVQWHIKSLDENIDYEPELGWRGALLGEWQASPLLALRAEFAGQMKAQKVDVVYTDFNGGADIQSTIHQYLQYWEGSLLLQVSPVKKIPHAYLLAGCSAGRLTNGWRKASGFVFEGGDERQDIDIDAAFYNRNSIAADFGLGGNIPLGATSSLKLEGRYQYGLSNFATSDKVDAKMNALIFSVGYLHRL